jgi:flavin reductase (DIM6/NTAB) family NADH-FMN oxidoreductase RutF
MSLAEDLKKFMRYMPAAVCVISTYSSKGPHAMTASSFTSCSLTPPLFCLNVKTDSSMFSYLKEASLAAIHLLSEEQAELSNYFASKPPTQEVLLDSQKVHYPFDNKLPVLKECPHYAITKVDKFIQAGDHHIFILELLKTECKEFSPLIYCNQAYKGISS